MHELAVMTRLVRMVEDRLAGEPDLKPVAVRVTVSVLSHLGRHDPATLRLAFTAAASGTGVQGADLEVLRATVVATCRTCGTRCDLEEWPAACPACGSGCLEPEEVPELVLQEIVVQSRIEGGRG